jgi:hypothetical protein
MVEHLTQCPQIRALNPVTALGERKGEKCTRLYLSSSYESLDVEEINQIVGS